MTFASRCFAVLAVIGLLVVASPSSVGAQPLVSLGQDPAVALFGDQDGAKWLLSLGEWGLTFRSDNDNTTAVPGIANTVYQGRTFRPRARLTYDGRLRIASRLQADMPSVSLYRATNLPVPHGTFGVEVPWDTHLDRWNMNTEGTEVITVPYPGVWLAEFRMVFASNSTGTRVAYCATTPGVFVLYDEVRAASGSETSINLSRPHRFEAGDTLKCKVSQTSGGSLNLVGNSGPGEEAVASHFSLTMMSS